MPHQMEKRCILLERHLCTGGGCLPLKLEGPTNGILLTELFQNQISGLACVVASTFLLPQTEQLLKQ